MKINKNSTLYKVGVAVFIVLAVVYYLFIWDNQDSTNTDNGQKTEVADNAEDVNDAELDEGTEDTSDESIENNLKFRNQNLLDQHYEKHGKDMGFASAEEYEAAAGKVVTNKETLHKTEEEDGDDVYYLEKTNEFVVVSTDGYIRTYFNPDDGLDYYNRQ